MSETPKLTKDDLATIRYALNCAIEERDGFADAYSHTGPEADQANEWVAKFEELHVKIFVRPTARTIDNERLAALPQISIYDLAKREPQQ